jgi:phage shock protein C
MLGGVCAGLGDYFSLDPTLIRLFFILLTLGTGLGFIVYIVLWIILPAQEQAQNDQLSNVTPQNIPGRIENIGNELRTSFNNPHPQTVLFIGGGLILLGAYFFVKNLNFPWVQWLEYDFIWPLLLILAGVFLLIKRSRNE